MEKERYTEKTIFDTLSIIEKNTKPLGCGTIAQELKNRGQIMSEATVGRLLRELDKKNLTYRVGYQGRLLTQEGMAELSRLRNEQNKVYYGQKLLHKIKVTDKEVLINVLIARRAIERETARQAVINITKGEIEELRKVHIESKKRIEEGSSVSKEDVLFHGLVAKASRNPILETTLNLIRQDSHYHEILTFIRQEMGITLLEDHYRVLRAIEEGYQDMAEKAMTDHIENIIRDVHHFWSDYEIQKTNNNKNNP